MHVSKLYKPEKKERQSQVRKSQMNAGQSSDRSTATTTAHDFSVKHKNPRLQLRLVFDKLQKEIFKALLSCDLKGCENGVNEDYRIGKDVFLKIIHEMCFVDIHRMTPIESTLVNDLWLQDLYAKQDEYDGEDEYTEVGHLVTLLAGITQIKLEELLVPKQEERLYHRPEGYLQYAKD